ncbi:hypothetical protein FALBO_5002 [Fusarium albosuccineum]|uniref:Uncharacterized protein n=1 Tax=Fusarium albosuccineum TaxID=1237068 RepID=A0A8H4LEU5_9HYPO|nr:hypothetical protein FALBO_5002 [Fusarium albosuccineum]
MQSMPSETTSSAGDVNLDFQQIQDRMMALISAEFAKLMNQTLQPQLDVLRQKLRQETDKKVVNQLGQGMVEKFHAAGGPFAKITHVRHRTPHDNSIVITLESEEAERAVRDQAHMISSIIGLSILCSVVPLQYFVQVLEIVPGSLPDKPHKLRKTWSELNGVEINAAFTTYGKLVLMFRRVEDARKLLETGFKLSADVQFKVNPARCVNCGGQHEAWSRKCKSKPVQRMLSECKARELQGPSWATVPANPPEQQTAVQTPSNSGGDVVVLGSRKRRARSSGNSLSEFTAPSKKRTEVMVGISSSAPVEIDGGSGSGASDPPAASAPGKSWSGFYQNGKFITTESGTTTGGIKDQRGQKQKEPKRSVGRPIGSKNKKN